MSSQSSDSDISVSDLVAVMKEYAGEELDTMGGERSGVKCRYDQERG